MTHPTRWRAIVRDFISTLPSGTVFRSRTLFDWAAGKIILDLDDLMPPNRPRWRSNLSRALQALATEGVIVHANEMPHCQAWIVP